jgi:hypothetical protein
MGPFTAVISLGSDCTSAHQIDAFFRAKRPNSPFDWLITPIEGLVAVLAERGARFVLAMRANADTVLCQHYGVAYHHEFPRDADYTPIFSEGAIRASREKLLYKLDAMLETVRRNRTLFLLTGLSTNLAGDVYADRAVTASVLNQLPSLIERLSGRDDFAIALILREGPRLGRNYADRVEPDVALDARFTAFPCPMTDATPLLGDPAQFAPVFRHFGLEPTSPIGGSANADAAPYA